MCGTCVCMHVCGACVCMHVCGACVCVHVYACVCDTANGVYDLQQVSHKSCILSHSPSPPSPHFCRLDSDAWGREEDSRVIHTTADIHPVSNFRNRRSVAQTSMAEPEEDSGGIYSDIPDIPESDMTSNLPPPDSTVSLFVALSVCLSVCWSVCVCLSLHVCLSVCLSLCISVCMFVCISVCL